MKFTFKKLIPKHQNNKFLYYLKNYCGLIIPNIFYRSQLNRDLKKIARYDREYIKMRVNYYNRLKQGTSTNDGAILLRNFKLGKKHKVYFFDNFELTRYFEPSYKAGFIFGDLRHVPASPSMVKSRPIDGDNSNSILLNINKIRHFRFINDSIQFESKKNMLLSRNSVNQENRVRFLEMYFGHPLCDIGQTNRGKNNPAWNVDFMTISEQLSYKFILCLEGYDVASNLKWVMSSNSIAVMPKPTCETWFMEGRLIANYHYIAIKEDFSDLEERLTYYINHTDEALQIINNAHRYIEQFKNKKREKLISQLVLEKYFHCTQQKKSEYSGLFA